MSDDKAALMLEAQRKALKSLFRKNKGFVAVIDVLGFSERIARDPEQGGLDLYIETVVAATKPFQPVVKTILFSDTVVLYTPNDSDDAFDSIAAAVSELSFDLLYREVP